MNTSYDWSQYNKLRNKLAIKIDKYNLKSKLNFFEQANYNHIRDIYALTLILISGKKGKGNILDFGGNLIAHANLINKINAKNLTFHIFNPHIKSVKKNLYFKYKLINKEKLLQNQKFDLLYFGSSLQYIKKISNLKSLNFLDKSKYILITHTPISFGLRDVLYLRQVNQRNLYQNIYSFNFINKKILNNKFKLIFKSINDYKYSGLKKKFNHIHSMNLLFKRK